MRFGPFLLSVLLLLAMPLAAQEKKSTFGPIGDHVVAGPAKNVDIITPHITDSHELELPFVGELQLPRWAPVHVGGLEIDLSPTKHVIMLLLAAILCLAIMIPAAVSNQRQTAHKGHAKGFAGAVESLVLFIRNEVVLPNVGHHGDAYVPFAMTLFFFILFANLLGLVPYGSTATGNISVTATLAILAFFVIEFAGMKAHGQELLAHDRLLAVRSAPRDQAADDVDHDANRDHRQVHEAVRARDPAVREHDGGARRAARAHQPHLHLRQLLRSGSADRDGQWRSACSSCSWRSCRRTSSRCSPACSSA